MSQKRRREEAGLETRSPVAKKTRNGISVGPAHLPDGTYKRHVKKIKSRLIDKAKTRKQYSRVKAQHLQQERAAGRSPKTQAAEDGRTGDGDEALHDSDIERDIARSRRAAIGKEQALSAPPNVETSEDDITGESFRQKQPKQRSRARTVPFEKEARVAAEQKREKEERRLAREAAMAERQRKADERERFRKAMTKARSGGLGGKRKLGRESSVLLQKIQKTMQK